MRGIRTLNPWGHVSKADRAARQELSAHISIHARISKEPEWSELADLCKRTLRQKLGDTEKARLNELSDALNAKGYSDRDIERAL
jgi:hypothetical protein